MSDEFDKMAADVLGQSQFFLLTEHRKNVIAQALRTVRSTALEEAAHCAEHLNGWGSRDGTADHIAKCIRKLKGTGEGNA